MFPARQPDGRTRAVIVGSGPSARGFIPPAGITVIAVNGAIAWLSRADYWFSLDPSPDNIRYLCNPRPGVQYAVAWPDDCMLPDGVMRFRRHACRGAEPEQHGSPEWWLWRWSAVRGLATDPDVINTGNSAYGALGLAYHLGFTDVALVGVDGSQASRVDGSGHPGNLSHLPLLFASARPQINVVSCGEMTGIPQLTFRSWLNGP